MGGIRTLTVVGRQETIRIERIGKELDAISPIIMQIVHQGRERQNSLTPTLLESDENIPLTYQIEITGDTICSLKKIDVSKESKEKSCTGGLMSEPAINKIQP
ncbi:uncharacterized protein G2W53_041166 [Senna tora]|uniref:Uncharacterized protein n=1 Tax=Senna tora TaxID=362788 RepID=A0A834VYZ1_9FABA|nr:uncharacterized protein G2W53_041166 [Senna tora]